MPIGSLKTSAPAGMVTVLACENVTRWRDPATAVACWAWAATSTSPTDSGVVLRRLDNLIRTDEPPIVVCTTIRIVSSAKSGPSMVMLGPHVAVRLAEGAAVPGAAPGTARPAASKTAIAPREILIVTPALLVIRNSFRDYVDWRNEGITE